MPRKRGKIPPYIRGFAGALILGLCLLALHHAYRAVAPVLPGEAHRAILRLRGSLVLVLVAWYGRYILLPRARWRVVWWLFWPGLALAVFFSWPFSSWDRGFLLGRGALLFVTALSLAENTCGVWRQAVLARVGGFAERAEACPEVRRAAAGLSFLTALAAGVGLFLLSIDYLFDYLLYSLFGVALVFAAYLTPLVTLAVRLQEAVADAAARAASLSEQALAAGEKQKIRELAWAVLARQTVISSAQPGLAWWDWLFPLGSSSLLILASILYRW